MSTPNLNQYNIEWLNELGLLNSSVLIESKAQQNVKHKQLY